jgi:predicted Ser/Thr protein kinase
MSKVCRTCPWWTLVRGRDTNTGNEVDRWDCSISFFPMLMIEMSAQARSGAAAVESFRNEVVERADRADAMRRAALLTRGVASQLLIEGDNG